MRAPGAFLAVGLLSSFCTASRAPVYVAGPSTATKRIGSDFPVLSFRNAQLYFAQRLGVAGSYSLEGADEATIGLLNQDQSAQQPLFTRGKDNVHLRRTLVVVEGVDKPEELLGDTVRPSFYMEKPPVLGESLRLVSSLLYDDREQRQAQSACGSHFRTSEIKDSIQGGYSASDPLGTCELDSIHSDSWWQGLSTKSKFDVMNAPVADIMAKIYNTHVPAWSLGDITGAFHIWTLHELAATHGISSSAYAEGRENLRKSLQKLMTSGGEATVVLSPYTRGAVPKRSRAVAQVVRRAESSSLSASATTTGIAKPTSIPRTTIASCYSDEKACIAATANCTGHGACSLKWTERDSADEQGAECWACVCKATVLVQGDADGSGRKTVYWGGPACQKKDVSMPFWLFVAVGTLLASVISFAMGMLYTMGSAELPSVLGAGVANVGARAK